MQVKSANIISILFHPLLMPFLGIVTILKSGAYISYVESRWVNLILLITFILTIVLPLSLTPFYYYSKLIGSIRMKNSRERIVPYFITFILFYSAHFIIKKLPLNYFYSVYLFAASVSVLLVIIITYFWKISTHMVGIGGLVGLIFSLSLRMTVNLMGILIIAIIVAGILGASRLRLNSHSPSQVYSGFILGFITIGFFCIFF